VRGKETYRLRPLPGNADIRVRADIGEDAHACSGRSTRRTLILVAAAWPALAWVGAVRAQAPAKAPRIGFLSPLSPSDAVLWHQAFRLGLRDLGWVEGKNISIEYRYAEGKSDRIPDLAADLVRLKVDVIVASSTSAALPAQKATRVIPIVIAAAGDPVALGLVESLARPSGNVTGLSQMTVELVGKRLELLKEIIPKLSRVAVLWNPQAATSTLNWKEIQLPARQLGLQLHSLEVRSANDFDKAFEDATRARAGALFIMADPVIITNLKRIAGLAAKSRLPSIHNYSEFVDAGGLVAYGVDRADMFRRAATFVDKILKGAKPGDLPIERPTKFELVVNLKTAKALGITIPQSVRFRADRVIE
jgi:putative ABC transport system substrate-binding protein